MLGRITNQQLVQAALDDDLSNLEKMLLEGCDPDLHEGEELPAIAHAAKLNKIEAAQLLLLFGAKLTFDENGKQTKIDNIASEEVKEFLYSFYSLHNGLVEVAVEIIKKNKNPDVIKKAVAVINDHFSELKPNNPAFWHFTKFLLESNNPLFPRDESRAIKNLEQGANAKDDYSRYKLGNIYLDKKDYLKALYWLTSCKQDSTYKELATLTLSRFVERYNIEPADEAEAKEFKKPEFQNLRVIALERMIHDRSESNPQSYVARSLLSNLYPKLCWIMTKLNKKGMPRNLVK